MSAAGLDYTLALLATSAQSSVATRRIRWESMARVLRILQRDFRDSPDAPLSEREVEIARLAWTWANVCMDGPVPPGHDDTGIQRLLHEILEAKTELGSPKLDRLGEALHQVIGGPHPGAATVTAVLVEQQETASGWASDQSPHVLVVRGEGLRAVTEWAQDLALPVDVVTSTQARQAPPWPGVAFVFGPPQRYTSSVWVQGAEAAASAGWLLTAPPAPTVRLLSWTGHRPLVKDGYAPWKGAPTLEVQSNEPDIQVEDDFLPESYDSFTPVAAPRFTLDGDETEIAFGIQFQANGETVLVYFGTDIGPKPTVVTFSDDEVLISPVPLRSVKVGNCLLLRTSSAGKDALDATTREWFQLHRSRSTPDAAIGHQQSLKKALRDYLAAHSRAELVQALEAEGVPNDYVRSFVGRALHPEFIAPQKESIYDRVCRAIHLDKPKDAFRHLKNLRTGRRQAGLLLSTRIVEKLEEMPDLPDQLRDSGAVLLTQPGVEGVALLVVRSIATEPVDVPTWRLGQLVTTEGHTWTQ